MTFNPYLTPEDESAEIVGTEDAETTEKTKSTQRQVIRGMNGEELPPEVQETLGRNLNAWDGEASSKMPLEFRAMQSLFEFFAGFSYFQESGTLLLSVAEVVDVMSNGDLWKVYRLHEAERVIMWTHSLTHMESVLESIFGMADIEIHEIYKSELHLYFNTFMKIVKWFQDRAHLTYLAACEELDKVPDLEFLESGKLSERSHFQKIAMGHPHAKRDVN